MSTGSAAIPLLKAAPEPDQLADRLRGGPWEGIEVCLLPSHVADDAAVGRAAEAVRRACEPGDVAVTAEAPVSWPDGSFVRVDRLDRAARAGIERSAAFAAGIGSPVLTIHLFAPVDPDRYRDGYVPEEGEVERFLSYYAETCMAAGVTPLIENVPPVLRMRVGGVYLSPIGGHWRDLLAWRKRIPELGFTIDVSHAALFGSFAAAYPSLLGLASAAELDPGRFVEELGPGARVAHVSDAHGLLGEGLPYGDGELDLDPLVRRLGELVPYVVAEINEPDSSSSARMKDGYREIARVLDDDPQPPPAAPPRRADPGPDWQRALGRRDPVPALLELQERVGDRRVLVTGGAGSIGRALASFLGGFRPREVTLLDSNELGLISDARGRSGDPLQRVNHVLCDVRDRERLAAEVARARPEIVFHLAAYKHVDLAERFPEEFVDTNLHGTWNVLRAADLAGVGAVVVASTDKAALAPSFYARTKRFMEQLTAYAARREGSQRLAVRLVNVLGSSGSASELFARQARAGAPLTVTDPSMRRYWITPGHAVSLVAQCLLLAARGAPLATAAEAPMLSVAELAERIWGEAGRDGPAELEVVGIRRGEALSEVLTGPGEKLAPTPYQGVAAIEGEIPTGGAAWVAERLDDATTREDARRIWLEAMTRPGLLGMEQSNPHPSGRW